MILTGDGLSCIRGERLVFADLSFRLDGGGALLIRGPNGSGKSTLLRLVAGLLPAAAGTLRWDDLDPRNDPQEHARRLHYVGHLDAVKPALSVAENLAFWIRLRGAPAGGEGAALARLGLEALFGLPARHLSAGQRRRLALARLAGAAAPLWLLDEPTVSLDEASVAALCAMIVAHRREGGMVLAATHGPLAIGAAAELRLAPPA
ncbi:MAG: heme ABC exporter ATP-binding protein CcmA [Alphaproteobacteria bacterium]|nr:heme ABC exporter ATP-binding protein CcmA [Alphaproteobacteria bacterium]